MLPESFNSLTALNSVGEAFYKTYRATSRFEVAAHLPFYKAANCLKRARKAALERAGHRLEAMLDEGLRILAEEM
ncbi:MAG TPA: hypothetical protein VI750_11640 [Pyrinomonadaceae bacterium]|nr:hypothetical protein [Pyrinomonadaceae bacterium]